MKWKPRTEEQKAKCRETKHRWEASHKEQRHATRTLQYEKHKAERQVYSSIYYQEHREKLLTKAKIARQTDSQRFHERDRHYYLTHQEHCKLNSKKERETNPDRCRALVAKWAKNHRKELAFKQCQRRNRIRGADGSHTLAEWQTLKAIFNFRCAYCGRKLAKLTQDHIFPISKGGSDNISNIVPACKSCNSSKQAKDFSVMSIKPRKLALPI